MENAPPSSRLAAVREWLLEFAEAVRSADVERGRTLFDADVIAFGSRVIKVVNLDDLIREQWQPIWSCTRNFQFHLEQATIGGSDHFAWAATTWQSQGQTATGEWFDRHGRASFVFRPDGKNWLAIHSHFSLNPSPVRSS